MKNRLIEIKKNQIQTPKMDNFSNRNRVISNNRRIITKNEKDEQKSIDIILNNRNKNRFNFESIDNKEDFNFNLFGGNDNHIINKQNNLNGKAIHKNIQSLKFLETIDTINQPNALNSKSRNKKLEIDESPKRNNINQPNRFYRPNLYKNNLNIKNINNINKEERSFNLPNNKNFFTLQNDNSEKNKGNKILIRNRSNRNVLINNQITKNKNIINEKGMINKRQKLPGLSFENDFGIIKNDKIFGKTGENFYPKKIGLNKDFDIKKEKITKISNDINSRNYLKRDSTPINSKFSIKDKKIIDSKENNIQKNNRDKCFKRGISSKQLIITKRNKYNFFTEPIEEEPKLEEETMKPIKNKNEKNDINNNLIKNEIESQNNEEIQKKIIENKNENPNTMKNKRKIYNLIPNSNRLRNNISNRETIKSTPNFFKIYDKINIFNSILLILNNNSFVNYYFQNEGKKEIIECDKNNKYCLSSILYYLNKYIWHTYNISDIPKENLIKKYNDFFDIYCETNYKNSNSTKENYCYNIKNIISIIQFIYAKINTEIINTKNKNNTNCNSKDNNSFISSYFMGQYQKITNCQMCQNNCFMNNMNYCTTENHHFPFINFDLNEVAQFINSTNNNFQINNEHPIINLDMCFNLKFNKKGLYCNLCQTNFKSKIYSIYKLPVIFTIILSNNGNCNFKIEDEIDLINYSAQASGEKKYLLISILCQDKNNDFILYNINHKDSSWYSYSNGKILKVSEMDIETTPLVLVYQSISEIDFEYNNLKIEETIKLSIRFMNGIEPKNMTFPKNILIKDVIKKIANEFKLDIKKIKIVINGQEPKDNDVLSKVVNIYNNNILVIVSR